MEREDPPQTEVIVGTGMWFLDRVWPLLRKLRDVGCERDRAGNRKLHFDEYCGLVLMALFNPALRSVHALQQVSQLKEAQRRWECGSISAGSFSESVRAFDPDRLMQVIKKLASQLHPTVRDPRLRELKRAVMLVDGTLVRTISTISEAAWLSSRTGKRHAAWRMHTQFSLEEYVPAQMTLTNGRNSGPSDEKNVLRTKLEPERTYVMDRWYASRQLFNDIVEAGSSYVCRMRDNISFQVVEERPLSSEAEAAQVVSDAIVQIGSVPTPKANHSIRLVMVRVKPHEKRSNRKGNTGAGPSDGLLRIATDMLDVPAEIIALVYQYRFLIELFFRFFKHLLGCEHLLSNKPQGVQIQMYCAIIACLMLNLATGRRPRLRTIEMFCHYFSGLASEDELLAHIAKERQKAATQAC
jgi:hypothetical protein